MKRLTTLTLAACLLTACGATKSLTHDDTKTTSTQTEVQTEQKTVTTETADTNVTLPGGQASFEQPLERLLAGDTLRAEENGTEVAVVYNPHTKSVKARATTKPRAVPVKINKRTEVDTHQETKTETEQEDRHVTKQHEAKATPWYFSPWPWLALVLLVLLMYLLLRFMPK